MSFMKLAYLPFVLGALALFGALILRHHRRFISWARDNWSMAPTWTWKLSRLAYIFAFIAWGIACLDLRGPEDRISAKIPDQRTMILLDVSSSMLVEDVRPNRFQKALLLARHFVKNAAGHQISLVLFSDTQKRLVPFTDDYDLLDSRLAGLATLDLGSGGSSLSQALNEVVQWFLESGSKRGDLTGNILVFTDSEETGEAMALNIPDGISVAMVGVGTTQGGPIPLRDRNNVFKGHKTYKGKTVESKLDEEALKSFARSIRHYSYWVASSYRVPTEEVLAFFRDKFRQRISEGQISVRPVLGHWPIIAGIALYVLSVALGRGRWFRPILSAIAIAFSMGMGPRALAQEEGDGPPKLSAQAQKLADKLAQGKAGRGERLKLAEELLKSGRPKEAMTLYEEARVDPQKDDPSVAMNYGTALMQSGRLGEGAKVYEDTKKALTAKGAGREAFEVLKKNMLAAIKARENQEKQEKGQRDQQDEDKKGQEGDQRRDQGEGGNKQEDAQKDNQKGEQAQNKQQNLRRDKNQQNQQEQGQGANKAQEQDNKGPQGQGPEDKGKDKDKNENKGEKDEAKGKEERPGQQSLEEKERQQKQRMNTVKVPAMLKQLLNLDRTLQNQMFDTTTRDRTRGQERKDW